MYSRELDGKTYTFGVSGKLLYDALLMYDHQTRALWSHITGEAVTGQLKGKRLTMLASMPQITWKEWRLNYPNSKVLSVQLDPRHPERRIEERRFDSYASYRAGSDTGISSTRYTDNRLPSKAIVIGVQINARYCAYPLTAFERKSVINDAIDGVPVLAFHDNVSGATAVFMRTLEGTILTFEPRSRHFAKDTTTGTRWNMIIGEATEGKLKGKTLERLPAMNIYWFAWGRYHPETIVYKLSNF